jgi:hypothetical protein
MMDRISVKKGVDIAGRAALRSKAFEASINRMLGLGMGSCKDSPGTFG